MAKKSLKKSIVDGSKFVITAELTGGPGYNFAPIIKFLTEYQACGDTFLPDGYELVGLTIPQSPGGVANIEPADVLTRIVNEGLLGDLDFIPHISCKDFNSDALISALVGYKSRNVESLLALTGDKPVSAKGVFELGAIGLLQLITRMNNTSFKKAKPEMLGQVHQFFAGAAVSPFKYTEASQMQQYYKMENKITAGAKFLITQVGWDWKKSLELVRYVNDNNLNIPIIGNVYFLTTTNPAPRLMHDIKLPGCFVSDELLGKLKSETYEQHMERAAQQIAMYKAMGVAGVDLGGVHDFETFKTIVQMAGEIGNDWEQYKDNLCWPATNAWYLYDEDGNTVELSKKRRTMRHRFFKGMHRAVLDPDYKGFHLNKKFMKLIGAHKGTGFMYKSVFCTEKISKYLIFDCEECGDCFLPENFGLCTIGGCEKGLDNAPCGDSTVDGYCGNNLDRICIGEMIYDAACSEKNGKDKLRRTLNDPRNPALEGTSSVVNYVFGYDHTKCSPIIGFGDALSAYIPTVRQVMQELETKGPEAFTQDSPQLDYIKALIQSQAAEKIPYIMVNLDALSDDPEKLQEMIKPYIQLVRECGYGIPVCIDSRHASVLTGGLKHWYNTDEPVKKPVLSGISPDQTDSVLSLKQDYDFAINATLSSVDFGVTALFEAALAFYKKAVYEYKFKASDIFYTIPVHALAKDMDLVDGQPGSAYITFEAIKKIKTDSTLKKTHCSILLGMCADKLPRKLGVCRAYMAQAMECGADSAFVDASAHFGEKPADAGLLKLVKAFAKCDGSAEPFKTAKELMNQFCSARKKPAH